MVAFMATTVKKAAFKSKSSEREEQERCRVQTKERLPSATGYSRCLRRQRDSLTGLEACTDLTETNER